MLKKIIKNFLEWHYKRRTLRRIKNVIYDGQINK